MKSYTDLEQSKKLAEILPLESADMKILSFGIDIKRRVVPINDIAVLNREDEIPCWSLAALLELLPAATLDTSDNHGYRIHCCGKFTEWHDTAVDAAVAMIKKLKEHIE